MEGREMAAVQRVCAAISDSERNHANEIAEVLVELGIEPEIELGSEGLLQGIKHGRWQLILLDVSPGSDAGLELLEQIRKIDSDVCVLALSSVPSVEIAVRAMKLAASDFLQKPVKQEELRAAVRAAVQAKGLLVDLETRLNQAIGVRLRERRGAEALTLKQLANRTGLSVSLISQIELGKSAASLTTLHRLATALQVKMTYFFETL
jgi:FixJ family two-component response regulator